MSAIHSRQSAFDSINIPVQDSPPVTSATATALLRILYAARLSCRANFCAHSLVTVTDMPDCASVMNRKYTEDISW